MIRFRLSLFELLLLPVAFLLAGAFILLIVSIQGVPRYSYRFHAANNELRYWKELADCRVHYGITEVEAQELDQWLAAPDSEDPPSDRMWEINTCKEDPWGNPYRCVERGGEEGTQIGFYSAGRDGVSKSSGNDADDLSTWKLGSVTIYDVELYHETLRERFVFGLQALALTPFAFLAIVAVKRSVRGYHVRRASLKEHGLL